MANDVGPVGWVTSGTVLTCAAHVDHTPCGNTATLAWVREACMHEHLAVSAVCARCRQALQHAVETRNARTRNGQPLEWGCMQCHEATGQHDDGTPTSHPCEVHIDGLNGELGTPETHPKPATTTARP